MNGQLALPKPSRSTMEIERWSRILELDKQKGKQRLTAYIGSRILGREFGENVDNYFERSGLTDFVNWSIEQ